MFGKKKASRLEARIAEFRTWWIGTEPAVQERNRKRLENVAGIARAMLEDAGGDGFGEKGWAVLAAAGTSFFAFGTSPGEILRALKWGMPETWPILEAFLPAHILADVAATEARTHA